MLTTTWLMLFIFVYSQEKCFCQVGCFTWDLYFGQLILTCRVKTDGSPVVIFDNNGDKITECALHGKDILCESLQEDQILAVNISNTELNITVQRSQITDYDGQWKCQYKTAVFKTHVSSLTGILYETTVEFQIVKTLTDTSKFQDVELRCSSCRIPLGYNAEFLINNRTIDSINYDPLSSTCYHGRGACSPQICGCDSPGNHFTRRLRVDMSVAAFFSCDMIFVDSYTTAKFSMTTKIKLDAQGFRPNGTTTRIIIPGKPMDMSTDKVTVSSNKYSTTKSTYTENKVSVGLLVGLTVVVVIVISLFSALIYHYVPVCKPEEQLKKNEDGRSQFQDTYPSESNEMTPLVHTEGISIDSKMRRKVAGFLCQISNKELTLYMEDKIDVLYQKLKHENSVDKQEFANFLPKLNASVLNYKAVNENFKNFGGDEEKYDYKIRDAKALSKVLLSSNLTDSGLLHEESPLSFKQLIEILNTVDTGMPDTFKNAAFEIQTDLTDRFSNDEKFWTEEKLSSLTKCVQLIAKYTGKTKQKNLSLSQLQGVDIFDIPRFLDLIDERGHELALFVEPTGKTLVYHDLRRKSALLEDNNAYNVQRCEKSFSESEENLPDKDQCKDLEWKVSKDNTVLNIKRYPFITDDNLPVHEVLIDVGAPNKWNLDVILERIRNEASFNSQRGPVKIIETALESFCMIVEIDADITHDEKKLKTAIEKFFWGVLEVCLVDLGVEAELNISLKLWKRKPNIRTAQTPISVDATKRQDFSELKLMVKGKLKTMKYPFFTSAEVWSDDEFLFYDKNSKSLIIYNFKTASERVIHLPATPFNMAVIENGKVAMSFPEKHELIISLVKNEKLIDEMKVDTEGKCYSLKKLDKETVLVLVKDMGIYSYNIRNNELKKLGIQIPDFVPTSDELSVRASRLVHTCRAKGSLHCYDVNGIFLWEYSNVLNFPSTVTLDTYGNVFATDLVFNKLYHIVPDGSSHTVILSRKDSIRLPSCLYFCEKRNWLLIVNGDNGFFFCYDVLYK